MPLNFAYTHVKGPLAGKRSKPAGAIPGGDLMETSLALSLVRELAEMGASVTWTGGGEPTLHPDFDEIVQYGATLGIKQGIYTHGGHIDDERAALLKRSFTFVYVSLDAATRETYKRDKGVNRFDAACDGIRRLVVAPGAATVGVGFLMTDTNWRDAHAAVRVVRELGADYIQFRPTILYDQEIPDRPAEDTDWMDTAVTYLAWLQEREHGFVLADVDRFRMYRGWQGHGYPTCWWSALQTAVTPNGNVWTCVNKREHPAALLGSLAEESFAEIWSRRPLANVDGACRVMCRGHLPNMTLTDVFAEHPHPEFV